MDKKFEKILLDYEVHSKRVERESAFTGNETLEQKNKRKKHLEAKYTRWFEHYFSHYTKKKKRKDSTIKETHTPCASFHQEWADLIISNPTLKALIEAYRSSAKSTHIGMALPIFAYLVLGELNFMLLIGQTSYKALKLLGRIQAELRYNKKLINDYGARFSEGDWSKGDFLTSDGVRFMALGFGQDPRGLSEGAARPDWIHVDDIDSKKHVNNNELMREGFEYIKEEVLNLFDAQDDGIGRFTFSQNNFHKNTIFNKCKEHFKNIIAKAKQKKKKSDYVVNCVNAVKNLKTFKPSWEAKTSAAYWMQKYEDDPIGFLRENMNTHVNVGKLFKPEYMQHKKMLPLEQYDALIFIGDLSYKDTGDFKAMFLIGKTKKEFHFILSFCRQCSRQEAAEWLYDKYEELKLADFSISYLFDGLFAQDDFVNDFDNEGELRGYYIPIIGNKKSYGNKYDHIESKLGVFKRLCVFWNIDEKEHTDQITAIDQFLAFEKGSGTADDAPDAGVVGIKELEQETFTQKFDPRIAKRSPRKYRH